MILDVQRAKGTLGITADTVLLTVDGGFTVEIYATFCNTGTTDRLVRLKMGGTYIFFGDATNSPLKGGQTLEVHVRHKVLDTETIQAWQSVGTDVEYFITVGVLPE